VEHLAPILDQIGRGGRPLWHRWRNQGFNRNRLRRELGHLSAEECAYLRKLARKRCEDAGIAVRPHRRNRPPSDTDATERVESTHDGGVWTIDGRGRISTLEELLDRADVDRGRWYVESWRANAYEAQRAGGGIVQLWQVKASLREHPAWV
jgi:hypothetical protein